ncbi:MAG TPA: sensor histidine kinase [Acidimicrobiales bacterium]|nr:sensor histidine kinase [Acidimicrobiales bacterium]
MTTTSALGSTGYESAFRHEALFYAGLDEFRDRMVEFIGEGVDAGEPVLVVVNAAKVAMLTAALGPKAAGVQFADMADVGQNPARIIPVWRDFVATHGGEGRPMRGVGEPAYAERTADEMVECRSHESLLNVAFAESPGWWLLCPYDTTTLDPAVVADARRTHPYVMSGGTCAGSDCFDTEGTLHSLAQPLPEPPFTPQELSFQPRRLDEVRGFVSRHAMACGLAPLRIDDLVLAVHELATNSLRHGGGEGTVRLWRDGSAVVCEVRDTGVINEPMIGRYRPAAEQEGGRGLWLVNQLCDLVQVRSSAAGSIVRLRMNV